MSYVYSVKVTALNHGVPVGSTVQVVSNESSRPTIDEIKKAFQQQLGLKLCDPGHLEIKRLR
jgi:hypothetical protein